MKKRPSLSTPRAVEIFEKMISCRRMYCADNEFFKMTEIWDDLCEGSSEWFTKTFRSNPAEGFKPRAAVIAFEHRVTLTVDERLFADARGGGNLSNFTLAHEFGHLALDHHLRGAMTKNFQLFSGPRGHSILPPTEEELEANYAGVFFQCGVALIDRRLGHIDLAHKAFSDFTYVKKAQAVVRLEVFQRELNRPRVTFSRVVF